MQGIRDKNYLSPGGNEYCEHILQYHQLFICFLFAFYTVSSLLTQEQLRVFQSRTAALVSVNVGCVYAYHAANRQYIEAEKKAVLIARTS